MFCVRYAICGIDDGELVYYVRGGSWPAEQTAEVWGNAAITTPVSVDTMHKWLKENPEAFIAAVSQDTI